MLIASWNVNSLSVRLPHVLDWIGTHKPDVLCLQETKLVDEKFPADEFAKIGYMCEFTGEKTYNGVATICKLKPSAISKGFKIESEYVAKRIIEVSIGDLHVINVYIPNGSEVGSEKYAYKLGWLGMLQRHLQDYHSPDEQIVLCGDFNIAPEDIDVWDPELLSGQILVSPAERSALENIKNWGFVDTFRLHTKEGGHFSWWDYRMNAFKRKMGLRIDHMWATQSLADKCQASWIDKEPRKLERPSDHAPVVAEFNCSL